MADKTRAKAAQDQAEIEALAQTALPEPAPQLPTLETAAPEHGEEIRRRIKEIDLNNSGSIIGFGARAQADLQQISQTMLADVKTKDLGPAGDSLTEIVSTLRGFSVSELDGRRQPSWWERLTGRGAPFSRFLARYETVQAQIDRITESLLGHEHRLLKDVKALDKLYERTLAFYDELGLYIAAGEAALNQLDTETLPQLAEKADSAQEGGSVMAAQELRDLRAARDDLDRRVHDLRLTRQVTMQALPSIRLVQENDKSLVTRINSTLVNTVPLWETQLAQALTIQRSREAAEAVRKAADLTNELLTANAENLRESNKIVRQEMERGVFDIDAIRKANESLIASIEDSLRIAEEGKASRASAEQELTQMESELRGALARASSADNSPEKT